MYLDVGRISRDQYAEKQMQEAPRLGSGLVGPRTSARQMPEAGHDAVANGALAKDCDCIETDK